MFRNSHDEDSAKWLGGLTNSFHSNVSAIQNPHETEIETNINNSYESDSLGSHMKALTSQDTFDSVEESKIVTHFWPRNFKFTSPSADHQYRLACFSIQDSSGPHDVASSEASEAAGTLELNDFEYGDDCVFTAWPAASYYTVSVRMMDTTKSIYAILVKSYEKMMRVDFEEYYESAIEECSYNNSDAVGGHFNSFFIDNVIDHYSDAPSEAPWYRSPIIFHTHLDLINNYYQGSFELIKQAAILDMERIHPKTTNLEQLEAYRDKINLFYTIYYDSASGGLVANAADAQSISNMTWFGEGSGVGGHATIRNIPNPVNIDYLGYSSMTGDVVTIDLDEL